MVGFDYSFRKRFADIPARLVSYHLDVEDGRKWEELVGREIRGQAPDLGASSMRYDSRHNLD